MQGQSEAALQTGSIGVTKNFDISDEARKLLH